MLAIASGIVLVARQGAGRDAPHQLASPRTPAPNPPDAVRMTVSTLLPLVPTAAALVVDVRTDRSYDEGHIAGAINVPLDEIGPRTEELIRLSRGRPIVTYCSCVHEHTSAVAAQELVAR